MSSTLLLTIKQAAEEVQMSEGYIRAAIRKEELPAVRFGRSIRIFREALKRWAERNAVGVQVSGVTLDEQWSFVVPATTSGYKR